MNSQQQEGEPILMGTRKNPINYIQNIQQMQSAFTPQINFQHQPSCSQPIYMPLLPNVPIQNSMFIRLPNSGFQPKMVQPMANQFLKTQQFDKTMRNDFPSTKLQFMQYQEPQQQEKGNIVGLDINNYEVQNYQRSENIKQAKTNEQYSGQKKMRQFQAVENLDAKDIQSTSEPHVISNLNINDPEQVSKMFVQKQFEFNEQLFNARQSNKQQLKTHQALDIEMKKVSEKADLMEQELKKDENEINAVENKMETMHHELKQLILEKKADNLLKEITSKIDTTQLAYNTADRIINYDVEEDSSQTNKDDRNVDTAAYMQKMYINSQLDEMYKQNEKLLARTHQQHHPVLNLKSSRKMSESPSHLQQLSNSQQQQLQYTDRSASQMNQQIQQGNIMDSQFSFQFQQKEIASAKFKSRVINSPMRKQHQQTNNQDEVSKEKFVLLKQAIKPKPKKSLQTALNLSQQNKKFQEGQKNSSKFNSQIIKPKSALQQNSKFANNRPSTATVKSKQTPKKKNQIDQRILESKKIIEQINNKINNLH